MALLQVKQKRIDKQVRRIPLRCYSIEPPMVTYLLPLLLPLMRSAFHSAPALTGMSDHSLLSCCNLYVDALVPNPLPTIHRHFKHHYHQQPLEARALHESGDIHLDETHCEMDVSHLLQRLDTAMLSIDQDIPAALSTSSPSSLGRDSILRRIRKLQELDQSPPPRSAREVRECSSEEGSSDRRDSRATVVPYEWITCPTSADTSQGAQLPYPLAIRTIGTDPILNQTSIRVLRNAIQEWWEPSLDSAAIATGTLETAKQRRQSRFTYQRQGNYEAHVFDDFSDPQITIKVHSIVNECLQSRIYPLVRQVFARNDDDDDEIVPFCVYDALFIRYNATEAQLGGPSSSKNKNGRSHQKMGAGQPLHRDLGLVSVNILLNDGFEGGGTFFERQLGSRVVSPSALKTGSNQIESVEPHYDPLEPIQPVGVGHAIVHLSSERHAGSATSSGVREILVLFLTEDIHYRSRHHCNTENNCRIQSSLLKQCRDYCTSLYDNQQLQVRTQDGYVRQVIQEQQCRILLCRLQHLRLSVEFNKKDGEAWMYLATAIMEFSDLIPQKLHANRQKWLQLAHDILQVQGIPQIPCDARVYQNMAQVKNRLATHSSIHGQKNDSTHCSDTIESYYRMAWTLLGHYEQAGCTVPQRDWESLCLSYGLFISKQDRFMDACRILDKVVLQRDEASALASTKEFEPLSRVTHDVFKLWSFCRSRLK